ncbi:uncharacterized protein L969DRAFT_84807 [Mixia osmundae IAM 14324]|nr:uncharacterized protein L969DRAFT_84807 [Mixia osmundae IAM 14324]KEI42922.1 hypothetical protein L969DRAFT_84807 [Mixia osmundae IAM 14324]
MAFAVSVKHAGQKHDLQLDPSADSPASFKQRIYEKTGVPVAQQKVLVKGGQLKDDADWSKLGIKPGHAFMLIGTAEALPVPPPEKIVFMEDMTDSELAKVSSDPSGLINLGNTCYMNSTVQVLRAIPELQTALNSYPGTLSSQQSDSALTASLRDLYKDLSSQPGGPQSDGYPPLLFWQILKGHVPQFQEMREGRPAQQDAEECWNAIVNALRGTLDSLPGASNGTDRTARFVQQYMTGEIITETKSVEAPAEASSYSSEPFLELKCNITVDTNYMMAGIKHALDQPVEKTSPTLGRLAQYQQISRINRMPHYLTVHFVRFYYNRQTRSKAKIMRKVKFPFDLDVQEILSDDLKKKTKAVTDRFQEIEKDRRERGKVRKRTKIAIAPAAKDSTIGTSAGTSDSASAIEPAAARDDDTELYTAAGEAKKRAAEYLDLQQIMDPSLTGDAGSNPTGLYELWGIVTHKGASAEGGHYLAWVKSAANPAGPAYDPISRYDGDPDKEEWFKFDDAKVTTVTRDKIAQLDGGGEDSSAYILLYRAKDLE